MVFFSGCLSDSDKKGIKSMITYLGEDIGKLIQKIRGIKILILATMRYKKLKILLRLFVSR